MSTLFLTSAGLSAEAVRSQFAAALAETSNKRVALVVTAAADKVRNQYALMGKESLEALGCTVEMVDIETDPDFDFSPYGVIYVTGGNTFYLLHHARLAHFDQSVRELFKRGGIYIGVSAGSIIMAPDISIVDFTGADPNDIHMTDFTAFGFTNWYFDVHYTLSDESGIVAYETKFGHKVTRLTDGQALMVVDDQVRQIG